MSKQQEEAESESVSRSASCEQAEPTPGPWEVNHDGPCPSVHAKDSSDSIAGVLLSADSSSDRDVEANARLIAAAGTAAQEAKEMGYDPVAAVETLPELLANLGALAEINARWRNAESDDPKDMPEEDHEETFTRMESLLQMVNALKSAEGSEDE
jgi:hypothetical protein